MNDKERIANLKRLKKQAEDHGEKAKYNKMICRIKRKMKRELGNE